MALFRDLDVMQLAENGTWVNESNKELPGNATGHFGPFDEQSVEFTVGDIQRQETQTEPPGPRELEFLEPATPSARPPVGQRRPIADP
jgi:hypothetical protein